MESDTFEGRGLSCSVLRGGLVGPWLMSLLGCVFSLDPHRTASDGHIGSQEPHHSEGPAPTPLPRVPRSLSHMCVANLFATRVLWRLPRLLMCPRTARCSESPASQAAASRRAAMAVRPVAGVLEAVSQLTRCGLRMCVSKSNPRPSVKSLAGNGLFHLWREAARPTSLDWRRRCCPLKFPHARCHRREEVVVWSAQRRRPSFPWRVLDSHRRTLSVSFFVCVSLSLRVSCLCPSLFVCVSVSECLCVSLCSCLYVSLFVSLTVGRVRRETRCNIEQKLVLARVLSKE